MKSGNPDSKSDLPLVAVSSTSGVFQYVVTFSQSYNSVFEGSQKKNENEEKFWNNYFV